MNWQKIVRVMFWIALVCIIIDVPINLIIEAFYPHLYSADFDRIFSHVITGYLLVIFGIRKWKIPSDNHGPKMQSTVLEAKTK